MSLFDEKKEELKGFLQGKGLSDEYTTRLVNHKIYVDTNGQQGESFEAKDLEIMPKNLEDVELMGAYLGFADFSGCNLSHADLRKTKLDETNFENAIFKGVHITKDSLDDIPQGRLSGVDLSTVILYKDNGATFSTDESKEYLGKRMNEETKITNLPSKSGVIPTNLQHHKTVQLQPVTAGMTHKTK